MAGLRVVRAADLVRVPWKNGGGTTAEVAAHPPGSGFDGFVWRISMADVACDGPFSRFPGIDRTLVLAEGRDLVLAVGGETRRLAAPGDALSFSGDADTAARLDGGPIRDINIMTRRGRCTHRIACLAANVPVPDLVATAGVVIVAALGPGVEMVAEGRRVALGRLDMAMVEGPCRDLTTTGHALAIALAAI